MSDDEPLELGELDKLEWPYNAVLVVGKKYEAEVAKVAALREGIKAALSQVHNKTAMILHLENALRATEDNNAD